MIPCPCAAIWTSTAELLDDSAPFTSTVNCREPFWNGQPFGVADTFTRQLCSRRSCGFLGRPKRRKYLGDAHTTGLIRPRAVSMSPGSDGFLLVTKTSYPSSTKFELSVATDRWMRR